MFTRFYFITSDETFYLILKDGTQVKITDFNISKFSEAYSKDHPLLRNEHIKMWTYTGSLNLVD